MEYWEFLLQKEGELTWNPLASPTVEIQEGRYRLAVCSNRTDAEVDVRITHESIYEDPPKRRTQKHSRCTNAEGLMVVIPYNYLKPGIWEFCCRPDLITDLMGDTWQHTLQLQVLPNSETNAAESQDLRKLKAEETKSGETAIDKKTQQHRSGTEQTKIRDIFDRENSSNIPPTIVGEVLASDISASESLPVSAASTSIPQAQEYPIQPPSNSQELSQQVTIPQSLNLVLDEDTYVARQGGVLTVSGQVLSAKSDTQHMLGGELQICLRDPQNSQILVEMRQMLPTGDLPVRFTCKVNIPPQVNTRLILGAIALYPTKNITGDTPLPQLATTSFTVTADVDALLSAIANNSATNLLDIAPNESAAPKETEATPKEVPTIHLEPSFNVAIPPLLNKSTLRQRPRQPLQLPTLPTPYRRKPKPKPEEAKTEEDLPISAEPDTSLDASDELELAINPTGESNNSTTPAQSDRYPSVPETSSIVPFKAQQRFFTRLNALATDEELSGWLKAAPSLDPLTVDLDTLFDIHVEPDAHLTAGEIVVDDEPIKIRRKGTREAKPDFEPLPIDEPIPTPKLEVFPSGELTSGQKVRLRVTLAYGLPRLGVKLWIIDRQTRSLLEDIRLIGDFAPNGWGEVEAISQVTVPFGCLEIRFEAIAEEIQTKRESHKVTVDRTVLPPDLPPIPPDEFEF